MGAVNREKMEQGHGAREERCRKSAQSGRMGIPSNWMHLDVLLHVLPRPGGLGQNRRGPPAAVKSEKFYTLKMTQAEIKIPDAFVKLLICSHGHLGGTSVNKSLSRYVFGTRAQENIKIIDINAMWEKFVVAARMFCSMSYPSDVVAVSTKTFGRKPVLKFCETVGATPITGRFIPGSFTNSEVKKTYDPRILIVSDTYADKQAVAEAQYCNLPTIAFANTDNSLEGVDVAIPMNNRSPTAIGAGFFILSRLISYMKTGAELDRDMKEVELFFFRDSFELEQLAEEQKLLETTDALLNVGRESLDASVGAGKSGWGDF